MLQDAVDDAWTQARNQGVSVTIFQTPGSAPCLGDRPLVARALANVLNNAIKYSPAQSTVQCSLYARGSNWAISVRDEGPGIDTAQQDRLFKPFSRLHDQPHPNISFLEWAWASRWCTPWSNATAAYWKWKVQWARALNSGWCCLPLPAIEHKARLYAKARRGLNVPIVKLQHPLRPAQCSQLEIVAHHSS